jgi:hypothetical protein
MKKKFVLIILVAALAMTACKKGGGGAATVEPSVTPVGTNDGTPVTKTIGSGGGSILSADGEVELVVPPGALSANTDITIQPITNDIPSGRGKAYRFTPDGQQFSKDVTIKFHYTEEEAAMTKPEYMQVAFQNADGTWQVVEKVTNDVASKTVSAMVNHFTDFTEFDILRLVPPSLYLKPNQSGTFEVSFAGMSTDGRITFALGVLANDITWKVNGTTGGNSANGTIQSTNRVTARYTAPAAAPAMNPVTISADINIPFVVNGQSFNKGVLTGQAFITGANYGVLIEHELTFEIGTGEKFVMKDRLSFNVHLVGGLQAIVDNLENSVPTVQKTVESPVGCVTTFTRVGTGQLNVSSVDKIGVTVNPIDGTVYIGPTAMLTEHVLPIIHTACPGVTPGTNELPIAFMGMPTFEFKDSGQPQVINENVPNLKQKITITPMN